jgi:hypothetical protein
MPKSLHGKGPADWLAPAKLAVVLDAVPTVMVWPTAAEAATHKSTPKVVRTILYAVSGMSIPLV